MSDKILELKKLNAAYIAALEYDYCPQEDQADEVAGLFETGVSEKHLFESFIENQGRRPDEIASSISDLIKTL